jgi:hypothetical protein
MVEVPSIPPSERYPGRPPKGRLAVIDPTQIASVHFTRIEIFANFVA